MSDSPPTPPTARDIAKARAGKWSNRQLERAYRLIYALREEAEHAQAAAVEAGYTQILAGFHDANPHVVEALIEAKRVKPDTAPKPRPRTESTDTGTSCVQLVMRTASQVFDIGWEDLKRGRYRSAVIARDITAYICHTRLPGATWVQISYEFGRLATDHHNCWGRAVGPRVRRKLDKDDPDYIAAWNRLDAVWNVVADGNEHLVTGEITG